MKQLVYYVNKEKNSEKIKEVIGGTSGSLNYYSSRL